MRGEFMNSKCRAASSVVLAGEESLTRISMGTGGSSTTEGSVTVVGVEPEPSWISGVRMALNGRVCVVWALRAGAKSSAAMRIERVITGWRWERSRRMSGV